ncbi:unnamed protein product [Protopolystoma xenopodis]|uniref:Uncharacterized protein n=1 Tax=Protopolystoma xenopodis TaxID=117903 RepID=A0A448XAX5_9PLAT|nr:unnamed protein product [Protopolystoma xenopodis]
MTTRVEDAPSNISSLRSEHERHLRDRDELLAEDFTTNRQSALSNGGGHSVINLGTGHTGTDELHHSRLKSVDRRLNEIISMGASSLSGLKEQRPQPNAAS